MSMTSLTGTKRKKDDTMATTRVERVIGVTEGELVLQNPKERQQYVRKKVYSETGEEMLHFVNIQTGVLTPIGSFSTPTLGELRDQVMEKEKIEETDKKKHPCRFYCLYQIDTGELQTRLKTKDRCMVQVASNFNCLCVASRKRKPNDGRLVELAHQQTTQGPAATFGPLAANLYRTHFCMGPPEYYSGQTLENQINLLDYVTDYAGSCINGKLTLDGSEQPILDKDIDEVAQKVRVGLQTDCLVMYGRNKQNQQISLMDDAHQDLSKLPRIDQCHVAAVNWNSLTVDHNRKNVPDWTQTPQKQKEIYTLSRTMLRVAYEGIYLAALARGTKNLYLTLVGGGVFGNPNTLIVEELARAHTKYANDHQASCLEAVYLCAYSAKDNVEDLLPKEGIEISAA